MILEVERLKVESDAARTLTALDEISFAIAPGEVLAWWESGAGKSITGLAVIRLLEAAGAHRLGRGAAGGRRIDNCRTRSCGALRGRKIGVIFQDR